MPLNYNEKGTVHVDAASCAEDRDNRVALLRSEHFTTSSSFALIQSATPGASLANAGTTELSLSGHCQADPAVPTARGGPSPDTHTAMNFMNLVPFVSDHGDPCIIRARCSLLNRKSDDAGRGVTGLEVTNMIGICSHPHTQIYIYIYIYSPEMSSKRLYQCVCTSELDKKRNTCTMYSMSGPVKMRA